MLDQKNPRIRWPLLLAIAMCVGVSAYMLLKHTLIDPNQEQTINIQLAKQHIEKLNPLLHADPRFSSAKAIVFTGENGSIRMGGYVASEPDLDALHKLVQQTAPPVTVVWKVSVDPGEFTTTKP